MKTNADIKPAFLGVQDAAVYLGICVRTLRGFIYERRIPFYIVGSRYLLKKADLDEWMEERRIQPERFG